MRISCDRQEFLSDSCGGACYFVGCTVSKQLSAAWDVIIPFTAQPAHYDGISREQFDRSLIMTQCCGVGVGRRQS